MSKPFSSLHGVILVGTVVVFNPIIAYAQSITLAGSNATFSGGCARVSSVPSSCATMTFDPSIPTPPVNWLMSKNFSEGLVIGTNLTDSLTGPAASGSLIVADGATVEGSYLYVGYEPNTSGVVELRGDGTYWTSYGTSIIGHYGNGVMKILDGAFYKEMNPDTFYVGYTSSGVGEFIVDGVSSTGARSTFDGKNRIELGNVGTTSIMRITNGGWADAEYTIFIGADTGGYGIAYVDGVHAESGYRSTLSTTYNNVQIGDYGTGILNVTNGGLVSIPVLATVGYWDGGHGTLNIDGRDAASGIRSLLEAKEMRLAGVGTGVVNVTNGGQIDLTGALRLATLSDASHGTLVISGAESEVRVAGSEGTKIGEVGTGYLNLSDGGVLTTPTFIVAEQATSTGVVNIGSGGKAGTLKTSEVFGGLGNASLNFSHSDDVQFAPTMTGSLTVNKVGSGTTTLTTGNTYTGKTTVSEGVLAAGASNVFSAASTHVVNLGGVLDLNGFNQTVAALNHAGTVRLGSSDAPGTTLMVSNDYAGSGGTIRVLTTLGDDNSPTDKVVIGGNSSGATQVQVVNVGGVGAYTDEGIEVITVNGTSAGSFDLLGDYVGDNGKGVYVVGAYGYQLRQGNESGTELNNWYLRSDSYADDEDGTDDGGTDGGGAHDDGAHDNDEPLYQAGVPLYESYGQILLGLNSLPTLQQRVGSRTNQSVDGTLPITGNPASLTGQQGSWARAEGWKSVMKPATSTSRSHYDSKVSHIQLGHDFVLNSTETSRVVAGVNASYLNGHSHVSSESGDGRINTDGYGIGGSMTWYGDSGVYLDNQASATWYSSSLQADALSERIVRSNKGFGYALSSEVGKRYSLNNAWTLTPQFQLTYSNVSFDSFTDNFGARVRNSSSDSLQARLGVAAAYETTSGGADNKRNKSVVYGVANLYNEFLNGSKVNVSGVEFVSKNQRVWAGLGLGGAYQWDDDRYAIYAEASVNTSLKKFGDSHSTKGIVGLRVRW